MGKKWVYTIAGAALLIAPAARLYSLDSNDSTKRGADVQANAWEDEDQRPASKDLRATVLLRSAASKGLDLDEVGVNSEFHDGDRFRLKVKSREDGYLYVLCKSSIGEARVLYPYSNMKEEDNLVASGKTRMFPAQDWYKFDSDPGTEHVYLVLASAPIKALDRAASEGGAISVNALERFVNRAAANSPNSIVLDGDDQDNNGAEYSTPKTIIRHLKLKHLPS